MTFYTLIKFSEMIFKALATCLLTGFIFFSEISAQKYDAEVINYSTQCEIVKDNLIEIDSVTILINKMVQVQVIHNVL